MEFERFSKEEWEKLPQNWCAKLVASYSKIPKVLQKSIEQRL